MKNKKSNNVITGNKEFEEMESQSLEKKNPYDFSFGSAKNRELKGFIVSKIASAISDVMNQSMEEITKIRKGTFDFLAIEFDTSKESDYTTIDAYAKSQLEALDHIVDNFERASLSMFSKFNDEFGKTAHITSLQSNKGNNQH